MYKLEIPDLDYWQRLIPCQRGCPVRTDSRGYVIAIGEKRYLDAYKIARGPNPFASICGRVCGAPCEVECRRGLIDEPISIRALKRYVTEQFGVESDYPVDTTTFSYARRYPDNPKAGAKVAVIGAGVAGMTAAHDLSLLGYKVTVFESNSTPGGMLTTGVPLYRLPRELVQQEIDAILNLGVELKLNSEVGKDVTINQLQKDYEAVLIAVGLQNSRNLKIEGNELRGIHQGVDFLKLVTAGQQIDLGEKVIVIGGGNVAFDVARSAVRGKASSDSEEQKSEKEDFYEAGDAARTALRMGAKEVKLVCLEALHEMPADNIEIEEGVEEGVTLHTSRGPDRIIGKDGKVTGLVTKIVKSVFDAEGRFNPSFEEGKTETIEADSIIMAIGQVADFTFLNDAPDIKITNRGIVDIDPDTTATNIPGIFAVGDVAEGAKLFINAIASGQKSAIAIDEYIRKKEVSLDVTGLMETRDPHGMIDGYIQMPRENPQVKDAVTRSGNSETIEFNYRESVANTQGHRCLKCHINTIFHSDKCIMCNGCIDVCPTNCLKLIHLSEVHLDLQMKSLVNARYDVDLDKIPPEELQSFLDSLGSVMIKDEDLCIRCGYCAKRCPTDTITMEWFSFENRYKNG